MENYSRYIALSDDDIELVTKALYLFMTINDYCDNKEVYSTTKQEITKLVNWFEFHRYIECLKESIKVQIKDPLKELEIYWIDGEITIAQDESNTKATFSDFLSRIEV